ncbi:OmpA family protein [Pelagimonas varians]|uniref:Outer membrane porin F n=1 Tax=Pelagimonas varians TaxID=696760 RepID=A0A238KNS3_9RHOB|nr:OmpA family protein [Pelagimonas varians]PYG29123.1 outer membrane protein OmpA-like peptidoglycan-associated protein [Pelagimonas varians]SMX43666.1 Outer membrane porin F precursor [Pelagimonas varians]
MMNITLSLAKLGLLMVWAAPAFAQDLSLPLGTELTREVVQKQGAYPLPVGPWEEETGIETQRIEGSVQAQSWRIDAAGLTPLQLMMPLREQLRDASFDIALDCIAADCGGFDFRFQTFVLPAPDMFVDLTDFHFLSATGPSGQAVSILTSKDKNAGFVQIIRAGETGGIVQATAPPLRPAGTAAVGIAAQLESQGRAVLGDLEFQTGSASLGDGEVASLEALADYLEDNPSRRILFVGHTDAVGSLEGNQALSRQRAEAAVTYLSTRRTIPASQIGADGVGYLAPIASNLTAEGRETNRRVEAILISTQ